MADQKLSALPVATTPSGTELIYLVQGGVSKQSTVSASLTGHVPYTGATSNLNMGAFSVTTPQINGVTSALTLNAKTTLLDEMYLGAAAIYGIWSWNAGGVILRSGSSAVNFTIGTPAYLTNLVSYNATGNIAIGGVTDNTLDQLQVSNTIGTPTLNLRGRSGAAPTVINFIPFDSTNSVINFRTSGGTIRAFIDLNISSGEMKFWGSSGGYFPTFGSNGSERMRIDVNGNIICGTAAIATNATNGFFYAPTCAGIPTGVPTTVTGRVPVVVDSTNNKIYIYSSGSWITSSSTGYAKSINGISGNTSAGSAANTEYYYICTASLTLTLPTAVGNTNEYNIKVNSGTLTINTTSSQTIDGSTSITMSVANTARTLISDGSNWQIF